MKSAFGGLGDIRNSFLRSGIPDTLYNKIKVNAGIIV